ncbi:mucin-associated surface protein (MASP), putative, partial [Trypanosoma cruzi]
MASRGFGRKKSFLSNGSIKNLSTPLLLSASFISAIQAEAREGVPSARITDSPLSGATVLSPAFSGLGASSPVPLFPVMVLVFLVLMFPLMFLLFPAMFLLLLVLPVMVLLVAVMMLLFLVLMFPLLALVLFLVLMLLLLVLLFPVMVLLFPVLLLLVPVLAILLLVEVNLWTLALSLLPQVKVVMEKQPRSVFHPMSRLHPRKKFCHKRKQGVRAPLRPKDSQRCHPTMKSKETILPQQWVTVLATTPRETNSKTLWKNNRKMTI